MSIRKLRIHGDNIIECERGLNLIVRAYLADYVLITSPPYMPSYEISKEGETIFTIELLPGHGRWGINLQDVFRVYGAPLRESVDALITLVDEKSAQEEVLLAIEFSSALPAGNNAWQRNGRALACASIGIPYLYLTEVGGVELRENRAIKASRYPNPIVPFSYLTASKTYSVLCLPAYSNSPSASKEIQGLFQEIRGEEDVLRLVSMIIERNSLVGSQVALAEKALRLVQILADQRRREDTLRGKEWETFLNFKTGAEKAQWLANNPKKWGRKRGSKVNITATFQELENIFLGFMPLSIGATEIPICLIPAEIRPALASEVSNLYGDSLDASFRDWLAEESPLLVVWITGFKPRGDDSRPDRGLVPLARMLFGDEIQILSVVSGPAKLEMWKLLKENPDQLITQNGLWEAILNLSDAVLADSVTLEPRPLTQLLISTQIPSRKSIRFPIASPVTTFTEHDVDSTLHLLFSHNSEVIFEGMCNPPGGDWSGLSIYDFQTDDEYRWTSLHRVSAIGGKRPDHLIQFADDNHGLILLPIESKDSPSKLGHSLGKALTRYIQELLNSPPIAFRKKDAEWSLREGEKLKYQEIRVYSGGAFCWQEKSELELLLQKGDFDIIFAIEFDSVKQTVLMHIKSSHRTSFFVTPIQNLVQRFGGRYEIQVH